MAVRVGASGRRIQGRRTVRVAPRAAEGGKDVLFNTDGKALRKLQAGADKLANVVGVTLGPKGRNVVLESKYGSPRIVNDGVTVAKEVSLQDPVENIGAKLVLQAAQKTNDMAGDGTTTATILSQAMIAEGVKVVAAGANPIIVQRGMTKAVNHLLAKLKEISKPVEDDELADVAAVSAGNNHEVGQMIADAMGKVGRQGVITLEEGKGVENELILVEGMQFDRGYMSPYFVTDTDKMIATYENAKILIADKKITNARDIVGVLEESIRGGWPLIILAEDFESEALATLVVNKLRGNLKVVAIKAPGFGERKSQNMDDIAVLTGGTVIRDEVGITFEDVEISMLGSCAKFMCSKEGSTIVTDNSTAAQVKARVDQIRNQIEDMESQYEREKMNDRIARLSGGVAVVRVGAQTETEMKEKKLRVEDALNATKAAVEEGIVIGGGCTLLRLSMEVTDEFKATLSNDEERVGADIIRRALQAPLKRIAHNAGVNGSVVAEKVVTSADPNTGYNAASGKYENFLDTGIIDPAKVIRCALENSSSVAKVFLTSDCVVTEKPDDEEDNGEGGLYGDGMTAM